MNNNNKIKYIQIKSRVRKIVCYVEIIYIRTLITNKRAQECVYFEILIYKNTLNTNNTTNDLYLLTIEHLVTFHISSAI